MRKKSLTKIFIITAVLLLITSISACKQKATKHVDIGGDKIYTSKEQLGGYMLIRSYIIYDDSDLTDETNYWFIIGKAENPKEGRRFIEVTEDLFINCDPGEVFPIVVEK